MLLSKNALEHDYDCTCWICEYHAQYEERQHQGELYSEGYLSEFYEEDERHSTLKIVGGTSGLLVIPHDDLTYFDIHPQKAQS